MNLNNSHRLEEINNTSHFGALNSMPSPGGSAGSPPVSGSNIASPPKAPAGGYKPNKFGRPCDACKRRKQRCVFRDGQDDVCVMCDFQNVPCTFTDAGMTAPVNRKRTTTATESPVRKRKSKSSKYFPTIDSWLIAPEVKMRTTFGEIPEQALLHQ